MRALQLGFKAVTGPAADRLARVAAYSVQTTSCGENQKFRPMMSNWNKLPREIARLFAPCVRLWMAFDETPWSWWSLRGCALENGLQCDYEFGCRGLVGQQGKLLCQLV